MDTQFEKSGLAISVIRRRLLGLLALGRRFLSIRFSFARFG
jgi:hypothetical protein